MFKRAHLFSHEGFGLVHLLLVLKAQKKITKKIIVSGYTFLGSLYIQSII